MTNQNDLPIEIQRALINQELAQLKQAEYVLTMRHRINKKLGNSAEELKPIEEQLLKLNLQIVEWEKELGSLKDANTTP